MRITHLEWWPVLLPLREPYAVAYQHFDTAENVFVRIATDTGRSGFGCAAPEKAVTGEGLEDTLQALAEVARPLLQGRQVDHATGLLAKLRRLAARAPAARAAISMALLDLQARAAGQPAWRYLGGRRRRLLTSVTVGIVSKAETLRQSRAWVKQGFRALKLKGGLDVEEDIRRVLAVRRAVGRDVCLRFDANQGYTVEQTLHFVEATAAADLELLEQPTPKEAPGQLGRVTRESDMVIMADECIRGRRDALVVASGGLADVVNLKLQKLGGIQETLRADAVLGAAGIECMIGCMDEAGLSIAAGIAVALASPNITLADLDGHLDLLGDPTASLVRIVDGYLIPNPAPGLGWSTRR